jgi:hypothetical protein
MMVLELGLPICSISPAIMPNMLCHTHCNVTGKNQDEDYSEACAVLLKKKFGDATIRMKGWAYDDDMELGFDLLKKLSYFNAPKDSIAKAEKVVFSSTMPGQKKAFWFAVHNVPQALLQDTGDVEEFNTFARYKGLNRVYSALIRTFEYGPIKRASSGDFKPSKRCTLVLPPIITILPPLTTHLLLCLPSSLLCPLSPCRIAMASKYSRPQQRNLNIFKNATMMKSTSWKFFMSMDAVVDYIMWNGCLPKSTILKFAVMGVVKTKICKLTYDPGPILLFCNKFTAGAWSKLVQDMGSCPPLAYDESG